MIVCSEEVATALMNMGYIPVGEVNGFWEFADSEEIEEIIAKLVDELE